MPPWHELVIYEMHIGTFHDEPDGRPGTFDRAIHKLDYLKNELSVNAEGTLDSPFWDYD